MQPRSATLLEQGVPRLVDVRTLKRGNQVLVRPGERFPVDGQVVEGQSQADESMLTGESRQLHKGPGDRVVTGAINGTGSLVIEAEQLGNETALAKIVGLVEQAQGTKAPIQCTTDRIVPWFVLITLLLATITFVFWSQVADFDTALLAGVSVLIITCPCAFGMATPISIVVSVGHAAGQGVLVRNGAALEELARATHVVFDKTGTLTEGRMGVSALLPAEDQALDAVALLRLAARAESGSEHAIARAIVAHARAEGVIGDSDLAATVQAVPGRGIATVVDGKSVQVGSANYMQQLSLAIPAGLAQQQQRLETAMGLAIYIAQDGAVIGMIGLQDKVRSGAAEIVQAMRARGLGVTMLTGDSRAAAARVAELLGGDMTVTAEVLPQQKDRVIADLQARGECVIMVGDGVNDAPALVRADIGVAMGAGTDVSMACADIVLMGNQLDRLEFAMDLARLTMRTIRQNIAIALTYNAILIPTAMSAALTPIFASIAMPISSLLVIGNAIMIRKRCNMMKRGH